MSRLTIVTLRDALATAIAERDAARVEAERLRVKYEGDNARTIKCTVCGHDVVGVCSHLGLELGGERG